MSNLDSKYIINLDLMQDTKNNTMHFNLSDSETSDFWINITRYGVDINEELLDKTVTLYVIKPNKNVEFGNISYDSTEKMYYCNLSSEFKNIKGNYTAQVVIYDSSTKERKVTRSKFKYYVEDDILSDASGTVKPEEQENILDDIISRLAALEEGGGGSISTSASNITITDTANNFTSTNVEGALQEVGSQIKEIENDMQNIGKPTDEQIKNAIEQVINDGSLNINAPTFLQGEKYIAAGDSIVDYQGTTLDPKTYSGTDLQSVVHTDEVVTGYIQEIEKRYGLICTNTGAAGATILSEYAELYSINYSDVALVTIAFGVNDARTGVPLGTVNSSDTITFAGCLNNLLKKIYTDNPECRVIVLTPIQRLYVSDFGIGTANSNGNYLIDFVDMCKKVANKRSTKCIDMYRDCGINQTNLYYYTREGVHPLNTGYKRMSSAIIPVLDDMMSVEFNPFGTMTNVGDTEPDEPETDSGGNEEPPVEDPNGTEVDIASLFTNSGVNLDGWGTGSDRSEYTHARYNPLPGKSYTIITYATNPLEDSRLFSYSLLNDDGSIASGNYMTNKYGFAQDVSNTETIDEVDYTKVIATFTMEATVDSNFVINIPCITQCISHVKVSYI